MCLSLLGIAPLEAASLAGKRPNIILVMTDDQGMGDLSCMGNPVLRTPHLDRFHAKSTRFTDFHVSPTCAPTRSAIFSGRHEFRNGVTHTIKERERMALSTTTFPQLLRTSGYETGIFGKWHLGDEDAYQPYNRGFSEVFIHGAGGIGQSYPGSCADFPPNRKNRYFDIVALHNDTIVQTEGFCTDVFFQAALGWIKKQRDAEKPFFAYISTNAPHGPMIAPEKYKKRFTDLGWDSKAIAGRYGMIENIDDNFGTLVKRLDDWNAWDDTLVIFMTDNGQARLSGKRNGKNQRMFSAGFRTGKGSVYEGGTHVPAFWRWKGVLGEGVDIPALTSHIDLFKTFCELAGTKIPEGIQEIDGRSLLPLLESPKAPWTDRRLFVHKGRWEKGADPNRSKHSSYAVRTQRWRFVNNKELYDISADPYEAHDVAAKHPDVIAALREEYDAWWTKTVPLMVNENAPYAPKQPQAVRYEKQLKERGIPKWTPAVFTSQRALELRRGDHVCLVGNALGERMQHHNFWETALHQRFPDKELVVRNLCFPGDEPFERIRSQNFGDPHQHLAHSKAGVVLFFFGANESFAGEKGLAKFSADMKRLVEETKTKSYDGKGPPRIVLVSPIAFESTGDPNLPDGAEHNRRLSSYTAALSKVAKATDVGFVDLFTPTKALFEKSEGRLTLNGLHLDSAGYRALAPVLDAELFGSADPAAGNAALKTAVDDKNFHWWHRYRAVNGYSIYGARGKAGSDGTYRNRDVMERERKILDQMCANRDRRIWAIAQGKKVAAKIDDSNTLAFITPKTNVGGKNDKNRKKKKLGTLKYLSAKEQRKRFKLAPGYEINLVASEERFPELANPVALNFDNKGRLWVATMASYPHWKPKTRMDDKLLIFEDRDSDGRADECIVFARGLHQPTGFEIGHGGVYVAQQPDILFLKDTSGDDRADVRIRQLAGFCSADSHHGIAAFEWGPDGGLYFQEGTFKFSQVESPYGLTRLHEAGIWRYEPRTAKLGVHVSVAFSNPWGHVFDRWGQNFIGDASPGNSYWAAPISGHIDYPNKHPGGSQHGRLAKQTGGGREYGGKYRFPTFYPKRTRPLAGCAILSSRHFPDDVQGNFLVTNCIGNQMLLNHEVREHESGFVGKEVQPIVSCSDRNFRPVDVQVAPDGSLYIVDWHNALIGHLQHNLREPHRDHSHGRIWRVTYDGRPLLKPAKIAGEPIPALLELLKEPEDRTRYRARRELAERRTADVVGALEKWLASLKPSDASHGHRRLEALWMYQTHNVVQEDLLLSLLAAKDHRLRAAATRVLSFWLDRVKAPMKLLRKLVDDAHPRVRLEAVRALSFLEGDEAVETALEVLEHDMDGYLKYTLDETLRQLQQE